MTVVGGEIPLVAAVVAATGEELRLGIEVATEEVAASVTEAVTEEGILSRDVETINGSHGV